MTATANEGVHLGQLDGRLAVITAGTAGIGLAVAERFVAEGADVIVTGSNPERAARAAEHLGDRAQVVVGDASDLDDLDALAAVVRATGRPVDVLVANAGRDAEATPVAAVSPDRFDFVSGLTFRGTFFTVQRIAPLLRDGGTIVLIGSIAGHEGGVGHSVYNASKAAVRSLARSLTAELAPRGIRANVVSPGPTATDGFSAFIGGSPDIERAVVAQIPVGRIGRPDEVAAAVLFLAGDQSSFVAGAELIVDGGMTQA